MGTVVVSVDAELGWGFHDLPVEEQPRDRIELSRRGWRRLVKAFEESAVPATWAVVGHLFERTCNGAHVGHPTPPDWFAHERGDDPMKESLRFAPELIELLVDGPVAHDVGSHTYSHVEFGADYATPEMAHAECQRAIEAAAASGVEMSSFVFPRNRVGHREALAEAEFSCYRGKRPVESASPFRKLARATILSEPPPLVTPTVDEFGLVNIPASLYLFGFEGVPRRMLSATVGDPIVKQAKLGVDAAARSDDGICHLWLHPNNLTDQAALDRIRAILDYIDRTREMTDLTVETMRDVAETTLAERASVASGQR